MKIKSYDTTVAYRCPQCGDVVFGKSGLFTLSGDMLKLKCGCEHGSELVIKRNRGGLTDIIAPCLLCGEKHKWSINEESEFSSPVLSCSCPVSNVNIAYIGLQDDVPPIANEDGKTLFHVLEENGFSSIGEFLQTRREAKSKENSQVDTGRYTPQELASMISTVLNELKEDGKIYCECEGEEQDLTVSLDENGLHVGCLNCGKKTVVPPEMIFNPYNLASLDEIKLK